MGRDEQGVRGSERYALVPRTLVFVFHAGRVLLLRGAPSKRIWPGRYNAIGGHVEPGEDILVAARRELQEEAGLSGVELALLGLVTVDVQATRGVLVLVLRGELRSHPHLRPSEEGTLEWVDPQELRALPVVPDLPALLARVLEHPPGKPPFVARSWYDKDDNLQLAFSEDDR
jgi:8-oxo-dGTP diphosphatase